jgi:hypothetical protein
VRIAIIKVGVNVTQLVYEIDVESRDLNGDIACISRVVAFIESLINYILLFQKVDYLFRRNQKKKKKKNFSRREGLGGGRKMLPPFCFMIMFICGPTHISSVAPSVIPDVVSMALGWMGEKFPILSNPVEPPVDASTRSAHAVTDPMVAHIQVILEVTSPDIDIIALVYLYCWRECKRVDNRIEL